MTVQEFCDSLAGTAPPGGLAPALQALWWAGKGDWAEAHRHVQRHEGDADCDLVHAHLHRQEGDTGNARYWYRRAGQTLPTLPLEAEWKALTAALLARGGAAGERDRTL